MNFNDLPQAKKGALGEAIMDQHLVDLGWTPYAPIRCEAHLTDRIYATKAGDLCLGDAKAKARRNKYPDTGINLHHYERYLAARKKHNIDTFLAFIDEKSGTIYGGFLSHLEQSRIVEDDGIPHQYPKEDGNIIYFPLAAMTQIGLLTGEQQLALASLSTRNPKYDAA